MSKATEKFAKNMNKARGPNFTKEEQTLLFTCLEPYKKIIESKKNDSETVKQADKQKAWSAITEIFNEKSSSAPRNTENLLNFYRNYKSKVKKQQLEVKTMLEDTKQKEALLNAVKQLGHDWDVIANKVHKSRDVCRMVYDRLKKEESKNENALLHTKGSCTPHDTSINKLKNIVDVIVIERQENVPEAKKFETEDPLKIKFNNSVLPDIDGSEDESVLRRPVTDDSKAVEKVSKKQSKTQQGKVNRTEVARKRNESTLINGGEEAIGKKRRSSNEMYRLLAEEKLHLIRLQKELLSIEKVHKAKMNELELRLKIKEIELMDLKISKESR